MSPLDASHLEKHLGHVSPSEGHLVAQLFKRETPGLALGHDLMMVGWSPELGSGLIKKSASDSLSLSLPLSLSLSPFLNSESWESIDLSWHKSYP